MAVDPARATSLFLNASGFADPAERVAYLERECGDDAELRNRVETLLRANEDSPVSPNVSEAATIGPDVGPDLGPAPVSITALYDRNPAAKILIAGRYTLQEKIGEGGMGDVWAAKQSEPVKRKVALKLIKPGMDSRAVLGRFEQERQALAMMDHPNIAKVLDAGMTPNGQPFFVMELVNGLPLNKFCDEARLTTKDRLELFVTICQAVQHAHQKGIVHRDLKPANILITMIDGKPVPKVIDFGVAKATGGKLTDESMSTQFGSIVGTLEYMSPEQAGFSGEDVDTRADIYSLGVVLYELLTGLRPIDAERLKKAALIEMILMIQEEEPSKPSARLSTNEALPSLAALRQIEPRKLMALLRGDLDWVVMKCLEKHRDRRYETANALLRDVQRYLNGDAVEACPPSVGYRMGKFLKRNKGPVLAASFVFLALVMGFIGTSWGLFRADRARQAEAAQRKIAVGEKKRAEASEALAKVQRTRAETREEQAIDAVKKFRDAVAKNPELKNNPALESLRKTLLKEPLAFFKAFHDRLQADRDTRPESLARLAQASFDLGLLTAEIGDKQDALVAYREALAIQQTLARDYRAVIAYAQGLANTHNNLGVLFRDTGDLVGSRQAFGAALAIQLTLAREHPTVTAYAQELATKYSNLGGLLSETGDLLGAREAFGAALAIQHILARDHPTVTAYAQALARTHDNLGSLLRNTGEPREARQAYESALAIQQTLVRDSPTVTAYAQELAYTHIDLGVVLSQTGDLIGARRGFDAALAIQQTLARDHPTATAYAQELANTHNRLGMLLRDTGDPFEAHREFDAALAIQQILARDHPTVTVYAHELAMTHNNLGILLSQTGDPRGARRGFDAALAIQQILARDHPTVTAYAQELARTEDNLGILLSRTGDPRGAREAFEATLAIHQTLARDHPTVVAYAHELARTHNSLGLLLSQTGDLRGTRQAYESALAIRERLVREHPESPDYACELGGLLNNIALTDLDARRFETARDELQQAIVWQKKALATNPRNPTYRQFLTNHLNNLIKAAQGLGDSECVAEAERELAKLRESDPVVTAFDARLAAIIKGDQQPKDDADRIRLGRRAYDKALHATAARLWAGAFANDPKLANDRQAQQRYNAACAAALAGCGKGKNDPSPDEAAKAKLRTQALDWLKAELAVWTKFDESDPTQAKAAIARTLKHWQEDTDLSGVRDEEELAKLAKEERAALKQLWNDVEALLTKVQGSK